jgi:hypothetical protein
MCSFFKVHLILGLFIISALHWILSDDPWVQEVPVPLMADLLLNPGYISAEDPKTWLRHQLVVSQEKATEIAFATVGQRENSLWAAVRKLRFTASNFGQILAAAKRNR